MSKSSLDDKKSSYQENSQDLSKAKHKTKTKKKNKTQLEIESLKSELEDARNSAKENWDKVLRTQAEMENLRKRNARDLENAHKYALYDFVKSLLTIKDSLTLSLESAKSDKATIKSVIEGIEIVDKSFIAVLKNFDVTEINPKDSVFDPKYHEAVTMIEDPSKKSNEISQVVQIGFMLNNRLVRPARVIVAK